MARRPELDGKAIAKAIAKSLPGWKLATKAEDAHAAADPTSVKERDHGPTLRQLRAKFLGNDAAADNAADSPEDYGTVDEARTSVNVEPDEGGAAKTADIENGEAKIVQG
jgi:hypothetical protein